MFVENTNKAPSAQRAVSNEAELRDSNKNATGISKRTVQIFINERHSLDDKKNMMAILRVIQKTALSQITHHLVDIPKSNEWLVN